MVINVVLATLKFLAILTAGLLGVVGLLVDFKKDGKVTQWGRRALIGTIISTVVAVFIQSIETYKQNIESRHQNEARLQQEKRNETTLHEIRRGLYLIKDAELSATIRIRETTGPTLQSWKTSGGLTTSWDDPKTARATVSPTFHTHTGERLLNSRSSSSEESGRSLRLTFG